MQQERLTNLLEPVVESLGYELILLEYVQGGGDAVLRLFIDHADGIVVEDCEKVSREVAAVLDVEDPIRQAYNLEVSSPGLDRPLTKPAHFDRFAGDRARITLFDARNGQRRFNGMLIGMVEGQVSLRTDQGTENFELTEIERAQLVPDFGPKRAHS